LADPMSKPANRSSDSALTAGRGEEPLEPFREPGRRGDEMPGSRRYHSLPAERLGERVADPLDRRRVISRGDERRDAGVAQDVERRARLAGQLAAVGAAHALGDVLRKRPVIYARRSREPKELAQRLRVRLKASGEEFVAYLFQ